MGAADQIERITPDDLAEAYERRVGLQIIGFHDPHRSAPGHVGLAVEERRHAIARSERADELHLHAFVGKQAERVGGVERRIKDGAKIFLELDRHEINSTSGTNL